jgi:hypothetical protein
MKQYDISDIPLSIWPDVVRWMVATFDAGSWDIVEYNMLETTEENFTLLCLRWA